MSTSHSSEGHTSQQNVGEGMILRTVRDERDIDRYAAFHTTYEEPLWGITCAHLLRHHPEISHDDFLLVEDEGTGELVSTMCLIPWHCRYEDVDLQVAMLEMVLTHPDYRRRGYIRAQVNRFHQMVNQRHSDLSIVWGIPYFYRQFGYTYAIDMQGADSLPAWAIPDPHDDGQCPYELRQAVMDDVPVLARLYEESMAAVQLHDLRTPGYWQFLLERMQFPVRVVEDRHDGRILAYVCTDRKAGSGGTRVLESAVLGHDVGMFVLGRLKGESGGEVQLGWPQTNTLVQIGRSLGSTPLPVYQWLLRIPDVARLLWKIKPVLERRVAASAFAGLTADVCINLFREAFVFQFKRGKLLKVDPIGFVDASVGADGGDLCIPPEAFVRLVFGYRGLDELRDAWPDIAVKPKSRHLVDVLLPKMTSFFCMPWQYYGPIPAGTARS